MLKGSRANMETVTEVGGEPGETLDQKPRTRHQLTVSKVSESQKRRRPLRDSARVISA